MFCKINSDLHIIYIKAYEFFRTILEPSVQLEPELLTAPKSTKSQASPEKTIL